MRHLTGLLILTCLAGLLAGQAYAAAPDGVVLNVPEVTVQVHGSNVAVSLPGTAYSEWTVDERSASVLLSDGPAVERSWRLHQGGIERIDCLPEAGGTRVMLHFGKAPEYSIANAMPGTDWRPDVPQVVLGFGFPAGKEHKQYPVAGAYSAGSQVQRKDDYGSYRLPDLPKVKYSDALVSLKVTNADFRDVLWLMSEIGNVSMMLDPYWADEPTGSRRPPGGGADPNNNQGGGSNGDGFRGAGSFEPFFPREGTGRLTLNFENVPFDQALDLVLMAVGLVKVDIYPGDLG